MKPMLPVYRETPPLGADWRYEPKMDGFRCLLILKADEVTLQSRNGNDLLDKFPEIERYLSELQASLAPHLPVVLDGELVWLQNRYRSDFLVVQQRSRLKNNRLIQQAAEVSPCKLLVFDLLEHAGEDLCSQPYAKRKAALASFCRDLSIPMEPDPLCKDAVHYLPEETDFALLAENIILYDGEGIVAKRLDSLWEKGKRTDLWQKLKNWRTVSCFITSLNKTNGYFSLGIYDKGDALQIGQAKHGFSSSDQQVLTELIKNNASAETPSEYLIEPAICTGVHFLHSYGENMLREPSFSHFLFNTQPADCTREAFLEAQYTFPESVTVTSPEKPIWLHEGNVFTKIEYLQYLRDVSSWMLPHLAGRPITAVRCPHGAMHKERFFQKNKPDYAPEFIESVTEEGIEYILCSNFRSLLWLGNQLTVELHTPFQKAGHNKPDSLILDLDPAGHGILLPAVKAAREIKKVMDQLKLTSFIKTSGNRGLQIHVPLPENEFTYQETRVFTDFLAAYLMDAFPGNFTTERLIKNRGGLLYLDFVQHHEGKTLIAPYSARANEFGGVAAPLYWEEITDELQISDYTVWTVPSRLKKHGCPFREKKNENGPAFRAVLDFLAKQKK